MILFHETYIKEEMAEKFQEWAKNEIHLPNDLTTFMDISTDAHPIVMKLFDESCINLWAAWVLPRANICFNW